MIINGRKIADDFYTELTEKVAKLATKPKLAVVLVGKNQSSVAYVKQKRKYALQTGMEFELKEFEEHISEDELLAVIKTLNRDENVSGFIVQLPLPKHIRLETLVAAIDPKKDVDGFTHQNLWAMLRWETALEPCTPKGVMYLLKHEKIDLAGKTVVILGRSNLVGKPLAVLCINAWATVVECNSHTKNYRQFTKMADVVIVAVGKPKTVTPEDIREGTVIIDVGFSVVDGVICGDADFNALEPISKITPVPGGVGAMTVAMLLQNVYLAHTNR